MKDHGLDLAVIGNGRTAALVDPEARLVWWCYPRFDSDPIFSRQAAEVMTGMLMNAELDPPVEGAGHFLQEDRGEVLGERIVSWIGAN